jgi:ornithine--oxo-acid transaminase
MDQRPIPTKTKKFIDEVEKYGAHNYHPLPVVLSKGLGEWVWDVEDRKYIDMLSAYSAVNQGHCHPKILSAMADQMQKVTLTSRAFHNDVLGPWSRKVCELTGFEKVIAMNSGAEAVETALKVARKWGYLSKNVQQGAAEIIVCSENFHGRTTTIVSFSTETQYQKDFGPFTPGFKCIPFDDLEALERAIGPNTVGFLFEPIQGEAGVIVPAKGYLEGVSRICKQHNVLLIADEIQTGLCRSGKWFAYQYENCEPDLLILGKALGGGCYPISCVLGNDETLGLLKPGDHGSTFGGNPLACAVSMAALDVLRDENLDTKARELGEFFRTQLRKSLSDEVVTEVRGKGLLNAIEINPKYGKAKYFTLGFMDNGLLAKDTRETTIRFAPPLTIQKSTLELAVNIITDVVKGISKT